MSITDEQLVHIGRRIAHELGGSTYYIPKRIPHEVVQACISRTAGMSVSEQVKMVRRELGVHRATVYRWLARWR